jgi:hypothetical protein
MSLFAPDPALLKHLPAYANISSRVQEDKSRVVFDSIEKKRELFQEISRLFRLSSVAAHKLDYLVFSMERKTFKASPRTSRQRMGRFRTPTPTEVRKADSALFYGVVRELSNLSNAGEILQALWKVPQAQEAIEMSKADQLSEISALTLHHFNLSQQFNKDRTQLHLREKIAASKTDKEKACSRFFTVFGPLKEALLLPFKDGVCPVKKPEEAFSQLARDLELSESSSEEDNEGKN